LFTVFRRTVDEQPQTYSINFIGSGNLGLYQTRLWKVAHLAERFHVSHPTIYDVLKRARLQEFTPRQYQPAVQDVAVCLKHLAKAEQTIQERLKRTAQAL